MDQHPGPTTWDDECDVLVVGSGGGALTGAYVAASHGLRTTVIEKADVFGGTTAYSGAGLWLPGNPAQQRAGVPDSAELGKAYLQATVGDRTPAELQAAFVDAAGPMVELLEQNPVLRFLWRTFPDYYSSLPSGFEGGRSIFPEPIEATELGSLLDRLRAPLATDRFGVPVPRQVLSGGQALIGRLLLALTGTGHAELRHGTALTELVVEDGRVVGVVATDPEGAAIRLAARRGVLLAAGGFERNDEARRVHQGMGADWTLGVPTNTGDALAAAMALGAATDLLDESWWCPGVLFADGSAGFVLGLRAGIVVDRHGRRYANESLPYDQFGRAMRGQDGSDHVPSYWIFDGRFADSAPAIVNPAIPDRGALVEAGHWVTADSLEELADTLGLPRDALTETVARFNEHARRGVDEDFHRGEDAFDRFFGDGDGANPCLVPVERGPFHALTLVLADLGTKGGLCTDPQGRVQHVDGGTIPGLYAAGNTAASVSGTCYPGPGTPVGTCMVFSYLAALDMIGTA